MRRVVIVVSLAVLCVSGSCARRPGPSAAMPLVVDVDARDYVFSMPAPDTVPAGPVTFRLVNRGHEIHMMQAVWLGERALPEFVASVAAATTNSSIVGTRSLGGPNAVVPGDTAEATVVLEPGHVALVCWVMGEDGKLHVLKGMAVPLEVTPAAGLGPAEPAADAVVTLRDYAIELSGDLAPGRHMFRVENHGPSYTTLFLFRMEPGATLDDIDAWMRHPGQGSPRARPMGGMVGLDAGRHGTFTARLRPGDYLLACLVPDPDGALHYRAHGMLRRFHVGI